MKQKILLFTGSIVFLFLTLSGYKNGPGAAQQQDFSGRTPGETCFKAGCHAGGPGTTSCELEIRRKDWGPNSMPVNGYIAGKQYIVTIWGQNTLTKFGFQVCAVVDGANAGTFSALPSGTQQSNTSSGIKVVEHSAPLDKVNDTFKVSFEWTAPATTSTITFHGILNAVDGDNSTAGDKPSGTVKVDLLNFTSIGNIADSDFNIVAYPNPLTGNVLNLDLENVPAGNYTLDVYDVKGSRVHTKIIATNGGNTASYVDAEKWDAGIYFLQLSSPDVRKVITVSKQ